jgi:hypothetical protein
MQSIRNAVLGCVLAAGVPSAFAYSNAGDNASFVQAHAWTIALTATRLCGALPTGEDADFGRRQQTGQEVSLNK